jgi:excisionase family DNA binding protein
MTTAKHCANGDTCAAHAKLGGPAKLSRYNPETVCSECLLARRAARAVEAAKNVQGNAQGNAQGAEVRRATSEPKEKKRVTDEPKVKNCAYYRCKRPGTEPSGSEKGLVCKECAEREPLLVALRGLEHDSVRCEKRARTFEVAFDKAVDAGDEYLQSRCLRLLRRAEEHWIAAEGKELRAGRIMDGEPPEGRMRLDSPQARRIAKKTRSKPPRKATPKAPGAKNAVGSIPPTGTESPSTRPAPRPPVADESPVDAIPPDQEPEARETLLRLVKDLEGLVAGLGTQQRQFADTARTLAETGENLARVAEALADQAPAKPAERGQRAEVKEGRKGKAEDAKKPAKDRQWLKVSETAARLAVQPKTVYGWIRDGELEATKFGPKSTRVKASELARFEEGIE